MATAESVARLLSTKLGELFSREEKKTIPIYKGSSDDIDIKDWLREAERVARNNDWSDNQKLRFFSDRLKGDALEWHLTFMDGEETSYKDWKKDIVHRFRDTADIELLKNKLHFTRQKPDQRMKAFISKVESLYDSIYGRLDADPAEASESEVNLRKQHKQLRDEEKRKVLTRGLLPKYKNELWRHLPLNPDYSKFIEALLRVEHGETTKELNEDQSKGSEIKNDNVLIAQIEILRKEVEKLTTQNEPSQNRYNSESERNPYIVDHRRSDMDRRNRKEKSEIRSSYDISGNDQDYFATYRKRYSSRSRERDFPKERRN